MGVPLSIVELLLTTQPSTQVCDCCWGTKASANHHHFLIILVGKQLAEMRLEGECPVSLRWRWCQASA